ncbi:MAG: D-tyrosyl-tRNA(Tyr) deacylase, partial [Actinobacteria bacterium]|nr:D-tyrosyl-tRNA(Tyr) deacylase [Actinomycetota bacterium]
MRAVIQRVSEASVAVDGGVVGEIGPGLCVLVGVAHTDTETLAAKLADKIWKLRIFEDGDGKMNRSVAETSRQVLIISQFTLYGDASKGRRPTWSAAAPGPVAEPLVDAVATELRALGATVAEGRFGADMAVSLVNDGPVTLIIDV